ncbi:MAG: hypothetical protein ACE5OY_04185 [Candidatus Bathyarchaeia archaeon]
MSESKVQPQEERGELLTCRILQLLTTIEGRIVPDAIHSNLRAHLAGRAIEVRRKRFLDRLRRKIGIAGDEVRGDLSVLGSEVTAKCLFREEPKTFDTLSESEKLLVDSVVGRIALILALNSLAPLQRLDELVLPKKMGDLEDALKRKVYEYSLIDRNFKATPIFKTETYFLDQYYEDPDTIFDLSSQLNTVFEDTSKLVSELGELLKEVYIRERKLSEYQSAIRKAGVKGVIIDMMKRYGIPVSVEVVREEAAKVAPPPVEKAYVVEPEEIVRARTKAGFLSEKVNELVDKFAEDHDVGLLLIWKYVANLLNSYATSVPEPLPTTLEIILRFIKEIISDGNVEYASRKVKSLPLPTFDVDLFKTKSLDAIEEYVSRYDTLSKVKIDDAVRKEVLSSVNSLLSKKDLLSPVGLPHFENAILTTISRIRDEFEENLEKLHPKALVYQYCSIYLLSRIIKLYNEKDLIERRKVLQSAFMI